MAAVAQLAPDYAAWLNPRKHELLAMLSQVGEAPPVPFQIIEAFLNQDLQSYFHILKAQATSQAECEQMQSALAQAGLHLVQRGLFNASDTGLWLRQACLQLLQQFSHVLSENPTQFLISMALALTKLSQNQPLCAQSWLTQILRLGPACPDQASLLQLGQILAWRSGLAHYRQEALAMIPALPRALQTELLGPHSLQQWQDSPWLRPETKQSRIQIHRVIGEFTGWGGHLQGPPQIRWQSDSLRVWDHQSSWQVCVDIWGCSWLKASAEALNDTRPASKWKISAEGQVRWGRYRKHLPQLANWRQAEANQHTLAVTMPDSFRIYLIGL